MNSFADTELVAPVILRILLSQRVGKNIPVLNPRMRSGNSSGRSARHPRHSSWDIRLSFAQSANDPSLAADILAQILLRDVHATERQGLAIEACASDIFAAARAAGEPSTDTTFRVALGSLTARCLLSPTILRDVLSGSEYARGIFLNTLDALPEIDPYVPHLLARFRQGTLSALQGWRDVARSPQDWAHQVRDQLQWNSDSSAPGSPAHAASLSRSEMLVQDFLCLQVARARCFTFREALRERDRSNYIRDDIGAWFPESLLHTLVLLEAPLHLEPAEDVSSDRGATSSDSEAIGSKEGGSPSSSGGDTNPETIASVTSLSDNSYRPSDTDSTSESSDLDSTNAQPPAHPPDFLLTPLDFLSAFGSMLTIPAIVHSLLEGDHTSMNPISSHVLTALRDSRVHRQITSGGQGETFGETLLVEALALFHWPHRTSVVRSHGLLAVPNYENGHVIPREERDFWVLADWMDFLFVLFLLAAAHLVARDCNHHPLVTVFREASTFSRGSPEWGANSSRQQFLSAFHGSGFLSHMQGGRSDRDPWMTLPIDVLFAALGSNWTDFLAEGNRRPPGVSSRTTPFHHMAGIYGHFALRRTPVFSGSGATIEHSLQVDATAPPSRHLGGTNVANSTARVIPGFFTFSDACRRIHQCWDSECPAGEDRALFFCGYSHESCPYRVGDNLPFCELCMLTASDVEDSEDDEYAESVSLRSRPGKGPPFIPHIPPRRILTADDIFFVPRARHEETDTSPEGLDADLAHPIDDSEAKHPDSAPSSPVATRADAPRLSDPPAAAEDALSRIIIDLTKSDEGMLGVIAGSPVTTTDPTPPADTYGTGREVGTHDRHDPSPTMNAAPEPENHVIPSSLRNSSTSLTQVSPSRDQLRADGSQGHHRQRDPRDQEKTHDHYERHGEVFNGRTHHDHHRRSRSPSRRNRHGDHRRRSRSSSRRDRQGDYRHHSRSSRHRSRHRDYHLRSRSRDRRSHDRRSHDSTRRYHSRSSTRRARSGDHQDHDRDHRSCSRRSPHRHPTRSRFPSPLRRQLSGAGGHRGVSSSRNTAPAAASTSTGSTSSSGNRSSGSSTKRPRGATTPSDADPSATPKRAKLPRPAARFFQDVVSSESAGIPDYSFFIPSESHPYGRWPHTSTRFTISLLLWWCALHRAEATTPPLRDSRSLLRSLLTIATVTLHAYALCEWRSAEFTQWWNDPTDTGPQRLLQFPSILPADTQAEPAPGPPSDSLPRRRPPRLSPTQRAQRQARHHAVLVSFFPPDFSGALPWPVVVAVLRSALWTVACLSVVDSVLHSNSYRPFSNNLTQSGAHRILMSAWHAHGGRFTAQNLWELFSHHQFESGDPSGSPGNRVTTLINNYFPAASPEGGIVHVEAIQKILPPMKSTERRDVQACLRRPCSRVECQKTTLLPDLCHDCLPRTPSSDGRCEAPSDLGPIHPHGSPPPPSAGDNDAPSLTFRRGLRLNSRWMSFKLWRHFERVPTLYHAARPPTFIIWHEFLTTTSAKSLLHAVNGREPPSMETAVSLNTPLPDVFVCSSSNAFLRSQLPPAPPAAQHKALDKDSDGAGRFFDEAFLWEGIRYHRTGANKRNQFFLGVLRHPVLRYFVRSSHNSSDIVARAFGISNTSPTPDLVLPRDLRFLAADSPAGGGLSLTPPKDRGVPEFPYVITGHLQLLPPEDFLWTQFSIAYSAVHGTVIHVADETPSLRGCNPESETVSLRQAYSSLCSRADIPAVPSSHLPHWGEAIRTLFFPWHQTPLDNPRARTSPVSDSSPSVSPLTPLAAVSTEQVSAHFAAAPSPADETPGK